MKVIWATAALVLQLRQARQRGGHREGHRVSDAVEGDTESMAQEERYCKVQHHLVSIVRAPDRDTLKQYAAMAGAFGANVAIVNDNWGISSKPRSFVQQLAAKNKWQMV
jgi:hypothetical protein